MKKLFNTFIFIFSFTAVTAQIKYDFYSDSKVEKFTLDLKEYLKPILGKTDTSYTYYVALTSDDSSRLKIDMAGKRSKVKAALLDFLLRNKDAIKIPSKGERILIPINVLSRLSSYDPVFNGTSSTTDNLYEATTSGYVYFVRPLHVNLAHQREINMSWHKPGEKLDTNTTKLKKVKNTWKDTTAKKVVLPPEADVKGLYWE
jgi:hypothetical protein